VDIKSRNIWAENTYHIVECKKVQDILHKTAVSAYFSFLYRKKCLWFHKVCV